MYVLPINPCTMTIRPLIMAWSFNGTKAVLSFQVLNAASKVSESTVHLVLVEQFLRSSTKPAEFISYKTYRSVRENRRGNKLWLMVVLSWYADLLVIHTFFVYLFLNPIGQLLLFCLYMSVIPIKYVYTNPVVSVRASYDICLYCLSSFV
jgi:hypothetical protein